MFSKNWMFALLAALVAAIPLSASAERIVEVESEGVVYTLHVIEHGDMKGDYVSVRPEDIVLGPRVSAGELSRETGEFTFPATAASDEVWFEDSVSYANGVALLADPETLRAGAEAIVSESNLPFRNSEVPHRFVMTELRHFQHNETGSLIDDWTAFNQAVPCDGRIHILFVNGGDANGIASYKEAPGCHSPVIVQNVKGFYPTFHNLESRGKTLAHEKGHGVKLNHQDVCPEFGGYNCGHCLSTGWCDVMGNTGATLPFFSDPNVTYQGHPMGVHGQADAVRYLREELAGFQEVMAEANPPLTCDIGFCANEGRAVCILNRFHILTASKTKDADVYTVAKGEPYKLGPNGGTGLFSFFTEDNIEILVKVLDACVEPFNRYWVFIAGLTDVETEVQVCDSFTGQLNVYTNAQGVAFKSIQDTSAFATCP
jgi:hypothetical protein